MDEVARIERHLRECVRCRREAALLREPQSFCANYELEPDATPAYRGLSGRIRGRRRIGTLANRARGPLQRWPRTPGWARWAIIGGFAAIIAMSLWVAPRGNDAREIHQTLGALLARSATAGTFAVPFRPDVKESELRRIVRTAGARVGDGPAVRGIAAALGVRAVRLSDAGQRRRATGPSAM